ncbi:hypothetical protein NPA08_02195 [Mycoplasmopsis citelli]|uniref:hypothetical protein n=1 Tax=Mycoplasmopsis citelli TaxID=171281 RepID=UPI002115248E|nr:hypothetical protein [Mycoplasmopsis citelli]UUD36615.1 hypothetical protein NPA08_02195 [Mycoplasmopsis citelli]
MKRKWLVGSLLTVVPVIGGGAGIFYYFNYYKPAADAKKQKLPESQQSSQDSGILNKNTITNPPLLNNSNIPPKQLEDDEKELNDFLNKETLNSEKEKHEFIKSQNIKEESDNHLVLNLYLDQVNKPKKGRGSKEEFIKEIANILNYVDSKNYDDNLKVTINLTVDKPNSKGKNSQTIRQKNTKTYTVNEFFRRSPLQKIFDKLSFLKGLKTPSFSLITLKKYLTKIKTALIFFLSKRLAIFTLLLNYLLGN